jgi:hypothetical protein
MYQIPLWLAAPLLVRACVRKRRLFALAYYAFVILFLCMQFWIFRDTAFCSHCMEGTRHTERFAHVILLLPYAISWLAASIAIFLAPIRKCWPIVLFLLFGLTQVCTSIWCSGATVSAVSGVCVSAAFMLILWLDLLFFGVQSYTKYAAGPRPIERSGINNGAGDYLRRGEPDRTGRRVV